MKTGERLFIVHPFVPVEFLNILSFKVLSFQKEHNRQNAHTL